MNPRIAVAAIAAVLAGAAGARAQVSGQPGIPTTLTTTPDASASPTPVIPPPPTPITTTPAPPVTAAPAPTNAPPVIPKRPAANPSRTTVAPAPPAAATPAAPAPPVVSAPEPAPAPEPSTAKKPRSGAAFYEPYLSEGDRLDREIIELTEKVRAHPSDAGIRNDLGNLLARRGFAKEAADQYRKAAKLDSTFYLADYNEGILWEKEGKDSDALKAFERSIKRKPGFPLSRFHLGYLLEKKGHSEDAIREYAKALRIDPSLRWPSRNPLVVQTRLLYRASLQNYSRDLAGVDVAAESSFADRAVWEQLHPQRPVDTSEIEATEEESAPVSVGTGSPTVAPLINGKAAPEKPADRRQQLIDRFRRNRAAQPAPPQQVIPQQVPPAEVPAPPEDENAPNPAMQQEEPPPPPPHS